MFKAGDRLRCIQAMISSSILTLGSEYICSEDQTTNNDFVRVQACNDGQSRIFFASRFVLADTYQAEMTGAEEYEEIIAIQDLVL